MRNAPRAAVILLACAPILSAWGLRGHSNINRAAVRALPADGPAFLQAHEDWIAYLSIVPDTWRSPAEPFAKILEDPNHGWFKEQFAFLKPIPRSRYEFVIALYEEHKRLTAGRSGAAQLTNVRWTGTLPYAAVETYERMKAAMRRYRAARAADQDTRFVELEIASYMGRLGHYTGDGAQPLHCTIHHDGWQGPNPNGYTTDPKIHGRFESAFVDLIKAEVSSFAHRMPAARPIEDPFLAVLAHLDRSAEYVEEVYQLDKAGAFSNPNHDRARDLTFDRLASGAQLLRDLTYTAWIESARPFRFTRGNNPIDPANPRFNAATGSAPPEEPRQQRIRWIAHRGGVVSDAFAESSPASLEEAVKRGYWMIELDVRESKDGVLVVQHDPDFARFYGVRRNVADMTWAEIARLRAGPGNTRPMTFRELCERAKGRLRLMIDTKEPSHSDAFYREMESAMRDNGLLESAYFIGTLEARRWFSGKARISATAEQLRLLAASGEPVSDRYFLFEWGNMTRESVEWAMSRGVPVVPSINTFHYRGDDPIGRGSADIRKLRAWGVTEFQIDSVYESAF